MYHYIREDEEEYPYFNHLNINDFKRQLDYFENKYGFLSQEEYKKSIKTGTNADGIVLTFDDGFKDHYNYVLPELNKRGLWGIFYIPTGVYENNKLLGVHRIHYLKGKYGSKVILDKLLLKINDTMLDTSTIDEFDKEIYLHASYKDDEKQLRRLLNYYIKYEYRDILLDQLMNEFFDETKLFNDVYLSKKEIIELELNGNIIGSHTISHPVLSRLSYIDQYNEIKQSFDFINTIVNQNYRSFCYPYGYKSSYNQDTLKILKDLKVNDACIFDNKIQKNNINRFELSRIDCNQFMEV